jgi:hypothetical protein
MSYNMAGPRMSVTLKYQNAGDETVGGRTLQETEPLIDDVLRSTSFSAQATFSPPLKLFVKSVFIGNYCDEFKSGRHRAPHLTFITATAKRDSRALTKFEADLWCEYIYSDRQSIAGLLAGAPTGALPAKLGIGEIRFDWIPEDAYVEIVFAVGPDQLAGGFEAACRSADNLLAGKWGAVERLSSAVRSLPSPGPEPPGPPAAVAAARKDNGEGVPLQPPSEQQLRELFRSRTQFQEETVEALGALFLDDFESAPISPQRAMLAILKETRSAMSFYSCFISYSKHDQEFAERLYADLRKKGVRCWFAPHDVRGGRKLHKQIEKAINVNDRLLLILSEHSMRSNWVKSEIAHAREKEIAVQRQVLFPVGLVSYERIREWKLFDADIGDDSAREIREYFIPDFSNWKDHSSYQKALESLTRDLAIDQR